MEQIEGVNYSTGCTIFDEKPLFTQFPLFFEWSTYYNGKPPFLAVDCFQNMVLLFVGSCINYLTVFDFRGFEELPLNLVQNITRTC
jgi:hypothetical protein